MVLARILNKYQIDFASKDIVVETLLKGINSSDLSSKELLESD
jgi:hypothetical protein